MRAGFVAASMALALTLGRDARSEEAASSPSMSRGAALGIWLGTQLIPSPLLVTGSSHVNGGLRWQVTPLLYSFGVAERPWRPFVVSPIARHSGSIELHASPEWACCASGDRTAWLVRTGLRMYLPLIEHGEGLSWSFGGSYYRAADGGGVGLDLGLYTLFGVLGLNVTVSPTLTGREVMTGLVFRYF